MFLFNFLLFLNYYVAPMELCSYIYIFSIMISLLRSFLHIIEFFCYYYIAPTELLLFLLFSSYGAWLFIFIFSIMIPLLRSFLHIIEFFCYYYIAPTELCLFLLFQLLWSLVVYFHFFYHDSASTELGFCCFSAP